MVHLVIHIFLKKRGPSKCAVTRASTFCPLESKSRSRGYVNKILPVEHRLVFFFFIYDRYLTVPDENRMALHQTIRNACPPRLLTPDVTSLIYTQPLLDEITRTQPIFFCFLFVFCLFSRRKRRYKPPIQREATTTDKKRGGPRQKTTKILLTRSPFLFGSPKKEFKRVSRERQTVYRQSGGHRERLCPSTSCCWPPDGCRDRLAVLPCRSLYLHWPFVPLALDLLCEREREREKKRSCPISYIYMQVRTQTHHRPAWLALVESTGERWANTDGNGILCKPTVCTTVRVLTASVSRSNRSQTYTERKREKNEEYGCREDKNLFQKGNHTHFFRRMTSLLTHLKYLSASPYPTIFQDSHRWSQ